MNNNKPSQDFLVTVYLNGDTSDLDATIIASGIERSIKRELDEVGISPDNVDYYIYAVRAKPMG